MKLYHVAAATLLLGTSALAWAPDSEPVANSDETMAAMAKDGGEAAGLELAYKAHEAEAKLEPAAWSGEPKPINASAVTWQPEPAVEADPDLDLAETSIGEAPLDKPVETAADDMTAGTAMSLDETQTAAPTEIATADLTTRPAVDNYPPCAPGPGDDRCIQLYEPGVRVALASWNQPTGGLIHGSDSTATAMGGPYEPVDAAGETAMNGDGAVDIAAGETAEAETTAN